MSTYSNRQQPALQNLLCFVRLSADIFGRRKLLVKPVMRQKTCKKISSCSVLSPEIVMPADAYIDGHSENKLNASCMTISGGRTEQLDIFCCVTGFTSDFLSFIDVQLILFFHGAILINTRKTTAVNASTAGRHHQLNRHSEGTLAALFSYGCTLSQTVLSICQNLSCNLFHIYLQINLCDGQQLSSFNLSYAPIRVSAVTQVRQR